MLHQHQTNKRTHVSSIDSISRSDQQRHVSSIDSISHTNHTATATDCRVKSQQSQLSLFLSPAYCSWASAGTRLMRLQRRGGAGGIVSPNASLTRDEPGTRNQPTFPEITLFIAGSPKVLVIAGASSVQAGCPSYHLNNRPK